MVEAAVAALDPAAQGHGPELGPFLIGAGQSCKNAIIVRHRAGRHLQEGLPPQAERCLELIACGEKE
jgi:hypothetical protein